MDYQQQSTSLKTNVVQKSLPIIFLAGRIEQSDLRFGLVQYNLSEDKGDFVNPCQVNLRKCQINQKQLFYAASFKIGYDIPENSEIYQKIKSLKQYKEFLIDQKNKNRTIQQFLHKKATYLRSMDGIQKSTHIFVWIQDEQCYGTLIQLGYAYSLNKNNSANKKIYIAYSQKINPKSHLWFAFQDCTQFKAFLTWKQATNWFINKI